ncbi:MAG: HAD family hydrolase [Acidimicrobiia bacterium]
MADVRVVLFDVGGVLLSNGWDRRQRLKASEHFAIDSDELRERHDLVSAHFETGQLTLDEYLQRTVFHRARDFTPDDFFEFMKAQSEPYPESLALLAGLAESGKYLLATLNNESRALNDYRIETFGLRDYFSVFLSSCYLGVRKPELRIFELARDIVHVRPDQCLFIEDRLLNVECAELAGITSILFQDVTQLRSALADHGVETPPV